MAIFVKFGQIKGDATHEDHQNWIAVESLAWGVNRSMSTKTGFGADREASQPSISDVTVTKDMDGSSIYLFKEACTGSEGKDCTIHVVKTSDPGHTVAEYKLTNTLISDYDASSDGDVPSETVSFNFTKVEFKYISYDEKGKPTPISASYDMATAKAG
jgi:type VI secretion system secreted protein Hcp